MQVDPNNCDVWRVYYEVTLDVKVPPGTTEEGAQDYITQAIVEKAQRDKGDYGSTGVAWVEKEIRNGIEQEKEL